MLNTAFALVSELKNHYKAPKNKLLSLEKQGRIIKVVKGVYETDKSISPLLLSSAIYGPSYISFETALSYWGWIPEKVTSITAATFGKNKTKRFDSSFGTFLYRDIPKTAFPYEVYIINEGERSFLIAGKEKSLCDTLYRQSPLESEKRLKEYLFENLRIGEEDFYSADFSLIFDLCDFYKSTNLKILKKIAQKTMREKS
ncbi:MAG: hypothetical protein J6N81_04030 [Treponema sp.]|nr:hypothetical protein [Treponema sp.]